MSKVQGELAEMVFQVEATRRGIIVSKPYGDNQLYDFISEHNGKMKRVQVKSTTRYESGAWTATVKKYGNNGKSMKYEPNDFDVLAVLVSADTWYLIPLYEINRSSIRLNGVKDKFSEYKNNWGILLDNSTNLV